MRTTRVACLSFLLAVSAPAQTAPKLLPFQGRLTDATGAVVADGAKVVQFKIYNAPVGGQAVWNGEVQKLTVNGGLVNTMLGSKASLAIVDFNQNLYLELTLDANNDDQITLADPPLLPRQSILPAIFSKESADSRKLAGHDWTPIFGINSPSGSLPGSKLADGSVPASKLVPFSITSNQIAPKTIHSTHIADSSIHNSLLPDGVVSTRVIAPDAITADKITDAAITGEKIATNAIANSQLSPGAVTWEKLAARSTGSPSAGPGQVGLSIGTAGTWSSPTPRAFTKVAGLEITMHCTGRPVRFLLSPKPGQLSYIYTRRAAGVNGSVRVRLNRVDVVTNESVHVGTHFQVNYGHPNLVIAPGCIQFLDVPPIGQFRYEIEASTDQDSTGLEVQFVEVHSAAYEL